MTIKSLQKMGGLQKQWLLNTASVVLAVGLVCVLAVTAAFAAYYYSNMLSDMENRAGRAVNFFDDNLDQTYHEYYNSCITYAQTYEDKDRIELQFIDAEGKLVASSYGQWAGEAGRTSEVQEAIHTRMVQPFVGRDPATGERILAASGPMIFSNGDVVGVLRFVTSTRLVDRQIMLVVLTSSLVLITNTIIPALPTPKLMRIKTALSCNLLMRKANW